MSLRVREAPEPVEPYIDARRLALLMGVSTSTVKRWVAAGMPSETWGMARTRRFRLSEAMAWSRARAAGTMDPSQHPTGRAE